MNRLGMLAAVVLLVGAASGPAASPARGSAGTEAPQPPSGADSSWPTITVPAGWNLIAGEGFNLAFMELVAGSGDTAVVTYTWQEGDTAYRLVRPSNLLDRGFGYWVYFSQPTTLALPQLSTVDRAEGQPDLSVRLPAGQWVLVGNPGPDAAPFEGGATLFVFDAASQSYTAASRLEAGQGAWAYSPCGGTLTRDAAGIIATQDACTPPPQGTHLGITTLWNAFEPTTLTAPAGEFITLRVTNGDATGAAHNWDLVGQQFPDGRDIKTPLLQTGESATLMFTLTQPGTYLFQDDAHPAEEQGVLIIR